MSGGDVSGAGTAGARQVIAVTGGTRGIGRTIAERFHAQGHAVAVCSRSVKEDGLPDAVMQRRVDVRRAEGLRQFVAEVTRAFGRLDVFVNCAGVSRWRAVGEIDEGLAAEVIEINVLGTLWGCAAAADAMQSGGCIINLSSLAGKRGSANNSLYCASKFAVNGITQALAKELGPRGIRVNAVCPVYVETGQIVAALSEPAAPAQGQAVEEYLATFATTQTALGRLPTAEEVADVVGFLASPAASAISGQCINVDCGTLPG